MVQILFRMEKDPVMWNKPVLVLWHGRPKCVPCLQLWIGDVVENTWSVKPAKVAEFGEQVGAPACSCSAPFGPICARFWPLFWTIRCLGWCPSLSPHVAEDCFQLKFPQNEIEMFCKSMIHLEKPNSKVSRSWWALIYFSEQRRKQSTSSCLLSISTKMDPNTDSEDRKWT